MNLLEIVHACLTEHFRADFEHEIAFGEANRADLLGTCTWLGVVRVELERRREDPVNNVVKAWRQAEDHHDHAAFTLVQIFSGYYATHRFKMENAQFVGRKMHEWANARGLDIRYVAVVIASRRQATQMSPSRKRTKRRFATKSFAS